MKHTKLSIIFIIILICIMTRITQKVNALTAVTGLQVQYNNAMDNAIADALYQTVDSDIVDIKIIDYATVTTSFLDYLALNLGLEPISSKGNTIGIYVPVIAYIVNDGIYLTYHKEQSSEEDKDHDNSVIVHNELNEFYKGFNEGEWATHIVVSERIPYTRVYGQYRIEYTLTDYVTITDNNTQSKDEGYYTDLCSRYIGILPSSKEKFDLERRNVIIECITTNMEQYIARHNKIAKKYGINYHFVLPRIIREEWYRTIDDISMIALFQGYPYGTDSLGYFNRVALSGARVYKNNKEYIENK